MTELVVYENHDVCLQHPARARVPHSVETIEQLLSLLSSVIAASSGDSTATGRYRFVYSLDGRPLWRVADCCEAKKVVVSCTPGFLQRKNDGSCSSTGTSRDTNAHINNSRFFNNNSFLNTSRCMDASVISSSGAPPPAPVFQQEKTYTRETTGSFESAECTTARVSFPQSHSWMPSDYAKHSDVRVSPESKPSVRPVPRHATMSPPVEDVLEPGGAVFNIGGKSMALPPTPQFSEPVPGAQEELSYVERVAALKTLLSLKFTGKPFVESELIFTEEIRSAFESVIAEQSLATMSCGGSSCSVVVEGPPRSGVSTALAYYSNMVVSLKDHCFGGCLLLPLNFELLFDGVWRGPSTSSYRRYPSGPPMGSHEPKSLLLDIPFVFMTVVRAVVDSIVAQRPSLRDSGTAIIESWEKLVSQRVVDGPKFTDVSLRGALGHSTLYQWESFAAAAGPILRAAKAAPLDPKLRDAVLRTVFVELVAQMASALHFSGVFYIIDGLRPLTALLQDRVQRPGGDAGVLLACIAQQTWARLVVGIDTLSFPQSAMLLSVRALRVKLLNLLSVEQLSARYGYPTEITSGKKKFPIQLFMGAPGYLRILHELLRTCTATQPELQEKKVYTLRMEDADVYRALQDLTSALQHRSGSPHRA
ncbi:hypothetical protein TRVL_02866 [Trypanosoma vivax]|nr:hypothetical protein TRVL_02866 [Trypanosoma vivax]